MIHSKFIGKDGDGVTRTINMRQRSYFLAWAFSSDNPTLATQCDSPNSMGTIATHTKLASSCPHLSNLHTKYFFYDHD